MRHKFTKYFIILELCFGLCEGVGASSETLEWDRTIWIWSFWGDKANPFWPNDLPADTVTVMGERGANYPSFDNTPPSTKPVLSVAPRPGNTPLYYEWKDERWQRLMLPEGWYVQVCHPNHFDHLWVARQESSRLVYGIFDRASGQVHEKMSSDEDNNAETLLHVLEDGAGIVSSRNPQTHMPHLHTVGQWEGTMQKANQMLCDKFGPQGILSINFERLYVRCGDDTTERTPSILCVTDVCGTKWQFSITPNDVALRHSYNSASMHNEPTSMFGWIHLSTDEERVSHGSWNPLRISVPSTAPVTDFDKLTPAYYEDMWRTHYHPTTLLVVHSDTERSFQYEQYMYDMIAPEMNHLFLRLPGVPSSLSWQEYGRRLGTQGRLQAFYNFLADYKEKFTNGQNPLMFLMRNRWLDESILDIWGAISLDRKDLNIIGCVLRQDWISEMKMHC